MLAPSSAPIPITGVVASEIRKTCAFLPSGNILVPVETSLPSGDATQIFAVNPVTQTGTPLATVPGVLMYY